MVRVPPEQRQTLEGNLVGKILTLPKDQPFNIHVKQSSQNPGANGAAQGAADANGWGEASCSVTADKGGAATARFDIGQAVEYRGSAPIKATVKVSYDLTHELSASPAEPETAVNLMISAFVRDSTGRIHPKPTVESLSSDDAPGKGSRAEKREFGFILEPGVDYQILLQGSLSATTGNNGTAAGRIALSKLQMDIAFSPAPPPATAPAAR